MATPIGGGNTDPNNPVSLITGNLLVPAGTSTTTTTDADGNTVTKTGTVPVQSNSGTSVNSEVAVVRVTVKFSVPLSSVPDSGTFQAEIINQLASATDVPRERIVVLSIATDDTSSALSNNAQQILQALTSGGQSISDAQANYLLDSAANFGASATMLADMRTALQLLSKNGTKVPADLLTSFVRLVLDPEDTLDQVKLDVSSVSKDFLLSAYLPDLGDATLALAGMEKILVLGEGSVQIEGGQPGMIVGDRFNQVIIGGGGSDTLVGGGGNDTLTGGSSPDVFGFNALGHYTITDFITGYDKLAFEVPGVTSKAALQGFLTSVTNSGGDTTFNFGSTASITLVGVNASGLFDDMLFNIS